MYPNQPRQYGDPRDQDWPPLQPILPEPRRRHTKLWITLGVLVVLLVGGLAAYGISRVVGGDSVGGGSVGGGSVGGGSVGGGSARTTTDRYLSAVKKHDTSGVRDQLCAAQAAKGTGPIPASFKIDRYEIAGVRESGDTAQADVTLTGTFGSPQNRTIPIVVKLKKERGQWRVC